jgi:hypothetical protein
MYRRVRVLMLLSALAAFGVLAVPAVSSAAKPAVLTLSMAQVGSPGNPSVGITPFTDAIYQSCASDPQTTPACQTVGGVSYPYGIGQLEVTAKQYVAFLNTVDPSGRNRRHLFSSDESGAAWPKYGQINLRANARSGHHYSLAYPQWADKPYGFANFLRSARFDNSLANGRLISKRTVTQGAFRYVIYKIRLSRNTERGMYDLRNPKTTRKRHSGFVVPSQDEWIKAAYFDPSGGGTFSYWKYPTNPGTFGAGEADAPIQATLNPSNGDVTNATTQPLSIFHGSDPAPSWCPSQVSADTCSSVNPLHLSASAYSKAYAGSLGTVGQAKTLSPWGTLDQGGNAVEWTDTITLPPSGRQTKGRTWRRLHGGISNAPAYQLWISAVGLQPQDNKFYELTYPWLGFRIGVVGDLKVKKG